MSDNDVRRAKPSDSEVILVTAVWMLVGFALGCLTYWGLFG